MDSIHIKTGEKRLSINDDSNKVIVFNPQDILFAEKFYKLIADFETKQKEFERRAASVEAVTAEDTNGFPVNAQERIDLLKEICSYIRLQIDTLFGAGTSQMVFGDALGLDMFSQFFDGITPYIQGARAEKIKQYTTPASAKRNKRK